MNKIETAKDLVRQELNTVCLGVSLSVCFLSRLWRAVRLFIPESDVCPMI